MTKIYDGLTEKEEALFDAAKKAEQAAKGDGMDTGNLKEKYKAQGEKVYQISMSVTLDDDTEQEFAYLFRRPSIASYDRYIKTMSNSVTKASRAFVLDAIVPEQKDGFVDTLEEYPAMGIGISNKLLKMLGLADAIEVKKL